jgi:DNA uptake protein ComE-like DNA-binding protein
MKRSSLLSTLAVAAALAVPFVAIAQTGSSTPAATPATPAKTAPAAKTMATSKAATTPKAAKSHRVKIDLNNATKDDLMKLKGVTDADADKIIAGRPYKTVSELKTKKILDAAVYSKIRSWLMVKKA